MSIHIDNLSCGYPGTFATQPISLTLAKPMIVGIGGANGNGKSTFARTLLGLQKPVSGFIDWDGKSPAWRYLPQESEYNSLMPISVTEIIESVGIRDTDRAITSLGDPFQILSWLDESFHTLSGGQKQRVLLTRAFTGSPSCVLLDEPTNRLDSAARDQLWTWLVRQRDEKDITIFVIDHQMDLLEKYADIVVTIGPNSSGARVALAHTL